MNNDIAVEPLCYDLLEQLPGALKETDGAVRLGQTIVQPIWLVEHHHHPLVPGVDPTVNGGIEDVSEGVRAGGVGLGKDAVADPAQAQHQSGGHGLEGCSDLSGVDGHPGACGTGQGVSVLNSVDREGGGRKESGLEDVGLESGVVDQCAGGILEGQEDLDLSSVVGLGKAPDVAVCNSMVEAFMGPVAFHLVEGTVEVPVGLHPGGVGGGEAHSGVSEVALIVPPCKALWVQVPLVFKSEATGFVEVGIEHGEEGGERQLCGYERVTSDGVRDPISVGLCSRG